MIVRQTGKLKGVFFPYIRTTKTGDVDDELTEMSVDTEKLRKMISARIRQLQKCLKKRYELERAE